MSNGTKPSQQSEPTPPSTGPARPPAKQAWQQRLCRLLEARPEIRAKLIEALETQHFMLTIHCQLVRPGAPSDLQHYLFQQAYNPNDIVNSLKHIATVHAAKTDPTAEVSGADGWV